MHLNPCERLELIYRQSLGILDDSEFDEDAHRIPTGLRSSGLGICPLRNRDEMNFGQG